MSDNVGQSCDYSDGATKQAVRSYNSVWMAHWLSSTGCKSATKRASCGRLSISFESEENGHHSEQQRLLGLLGGEKKNDSECEKGCSEVPETKRVKVFDDSVKAGLEKLRRPFPMFNCLQGNGDNVLARKDEQGSGTYWGKLKSRTECDSGSERCLSSMRRWASEEETVSRENRLKLEGSLEYPEEEGIIENNSLAMKRYNKDDFMASTSKIVPCGFNLLRKTPVRSVSKQEENVSSNSILESGERMTNTVYHSNSMFLVNEKAVNDLFGRSRNPILRPNELDLLPHDPSTSRSQQPEFVSPKIQDHTGIGLFPSKISPIELTKSEKLYHECFSVPSLPCAEHDMEARRTCTTVDSTEESSRGPKNFSSAHHFRLTERSAFDLNEEGDILRESTVSTKMKEKASSELFRFDQHNCFPIGTGAKLLLLGSSTASEEEKDGGELKTSSVNLKNESSAETNTMDLDTFRKNHISGVVSSSSNRHFEMEQHSPTSQTALTPAREIGGRLQKIKFLDINQEPNNFAAYASSADTSTSKTQSLDAEHLLSNAEQPILSNAEQPTNLKSTTCVVGCLERELSSRWVKRLKLSPTSACGTQSSKMEDDYSYGKGNNFFSKIMKSSITSSRPITGRSRVKEQSSSQQRTTLCNDKFLSSEYVRENRDVTLSHPWIQRLCHNAVASPLEKFKPVEISKPQCSKSTADKCLKKQFPSLAAMALMGKAVGEFRSCQFRRKGSSVVWSS